MSFAQNDESYVSETKLEKIWNLKLKRQVTRPKNFAWNERDVHKPYGSHKPYGIYMHVVQFVNMPKLKFVWV